eukprot:7576409-Prorocentrum_lima.AAC.1
MVSTTVETRYCMSGSNRCKCPNKATKGGTKIAVGLLEAPLQNNHVGYVHGSNTRTSLLVLLQEERDPELE